MKNFSKDIERRLMFLSSKTDDIFSENAINVIEKGTTAKIIKKNDSNLLRIKSQLPNGNYIHLKELIRVIKHNMITNNKSSVEYSTLTIDRPAFKPCKRIPYGNGNIITGRDKEIAEILLTLSKKDKRSVIIVGEPGTGKTAIVRAINGLLRDRNVPRTLMGCEIHNMDIPYIFTTYKEDPMGHIINILEAASHDDNHLIFIDEVHQLFSQKMNDVLKPYLTEKIRFIGSTTVDEYHSIVTEDKALERRFTIVKVEEPNIQQTSKMIINTKKVYQEYHNCSIPDDVVTYMVENGSRFLGHRKNPDKSLDILDTACTIMNTNEINTVTDKQEVTGDELIDMNNDIKEISTMKTLPGKRLLTKEYVDKGISSITGIDYSSIKNSMNYNYICKELHGCVFGQDEQIKELANVVNIMKHINFDQDKPLSTMLLVGGPGTGKSTSVTKLASLIFGTETNIIDYDMGGFTSEFMITELKGAPPGYVGYAKSGKLIKEIRNKPQSIVHFRNINKCHESVLDYLLTSVRKGRMVDSAEREVRLNNTIIIFSATLSDDDLNRVSKGSNGIGFKTGTNSKDPEEVMKTVINKELINAVSSTIIFNELKNDTLDSIYDANIDKYLRMYKDVKIDRNKLKELVMNGAKNGHDIISGLSAQIPKLIFNNLKPSKEDTANG
jgi:ATP-dependent Clp protease ATP-binding subunit ClpC